MQGSLIYTKLIKGFAPNLEFSPFYKVIHGSSTFKLATVKFDISDLFFFFSIFFIPMSGTISVINRNGACYFVHTSN